MGRSDGSIKGEKYFDCSLGYGGFLRGKNVKVGEYPEVDVFNSDDEGETETATKPINDNDDDEM